jgi:hypothetical protein
MPLHRPSLLLITAVIVVGCGGAGGSATPRATGASSLAPPATATAAPAASGPAAAGQTDTEWGRIWDTLPTGFPRYAGSTPSEEGATGPASATLAIPGNVAAAVATWIAGQLTGDGYTVDGATAPLEDGSFVLDAGKGPGCRAQVTVAPIGGMTTVTVLYGAACPHP